jgi:hypothetical protein
MELCVPLMDHPSDDFLRKLEEDLIKLLLEHGSAVSSLCCFFLNGVVLKQTFLVQQHKTSVITWRLEPDFLVQVVFA